MADDRSEFPDLEPDDEVTIDGADLLTEIQASQNQAVLPESDELTIDGVDLARELIASKTEKTPALASPSPTALETERWRPPAPVGSSLVPTSENRSGKAQLVAALIAVLVSLGAAAWLGHASNAAPTQGDPALEGEEGQ